MTLSTWIHAGLRATAVLTFGLQLSAQATAQSRRVAAALAACGGLLAGCFI